MAQTKTITAKLKKFPTYDEFVDQLVEKLGLKNIPKNVLSDLREQISQMIDVRIMDTVIGAFSDEDFFMVDYLMGNFEELDEMDAVLVVASEKPHLSELLNKMMEEITEDLENYSARVQAFLNEDAIEKTSKKKTKKN